AATTCEGSTLSPPLDGNIQSNSPFGPRDPNIGASGFHYGIDFPVPDGTTVRAMAGGIVERIAVQTNRAGQVVGWGQYMVIRHSDGSKTLNAHLLSTSVAQNATVNVGDVIGLSDSSGGVTGPHLHIEYAPNGQIYDRDSKVDPEPCIDQNVTGSITVRDNGTLADDAFILAINGLVVCRTAIGASNTCAVGNLRPGTATLTLTAIIAPDNVGTYEISLADGLTFGDGSTVRSGTLPQGGAALFSISIPRK
ncbi:MAG: M23 family metallopeptidase, partial [Pseudomonadota bacterium]|nr:M23 family metallopeptidase [Pseudomonadota bacterium]